MAALVPVALAALPPIHDYPSHLARIFVMHDLLTERRFAAFYTLHPAVIPNLAMDAVVLALERLGVPVEAAGRIFIALVILGMGFGTIAVHRRLFGRMSPVPALAFAFAYNPILMFGFMNYLFGLAVALFGFAFWLRARDHGRGQPFGWRLALGLLGWSVVAFFCHLMAVGLLLGLIGAHELDRLCRPQDGLAWAARLAVAGRAALVMAPSLAAVAALYLAAPLAGTVATRPAEWSPAMLASELPYRVHALLHPHDAYNAALDHVLAASMVAAVLLALLRGRLRIARPMLLPIATLAVACLVLPDQWAGTSFIAYRLPIFVLLLTVASVDIVPTRLPSVPTASRGRRQAVLALLVGGFVVARSASAADAWQAGSRFYQPILAAMARLPPGARIYSTILYRGSLLSALQLPWSHLASMATIRAGLFSADLFADPAQNLLVPTPAYEPLARLAPLGFAATPGMLPDFDHDAFAPARLARFDYALIEHPEFYPGGIPAGLRVLARSQGAVLFAIDHASGGQPGTPP